MNKRSLLILGAGVYQLPLIVKAKELGIRTIVVSPFGSYPGISLADEHWNFDTKDKYKIIKEASKVELYGAITTGTDVCLPTLGYLVDKLNLFGPSLSSTYNCTNKKLMKLKLKEYGILTAPFEIVTSFDEALDVSEKMGYPIIVKAIDSSGSRGITVVKNTQSLTYAWSNAKSITNSNDVLLEKYLDGIEFGAQALVVGNTLMKVIPHNEKYITI